ncbi:PDZ and LIM domain protein Zasp, partial [Fragariocoptes setiger]
MDNKVSAANITVKLIRGDPSSPWGFRLEGGRDFSTNLTISKHSLHAPYSVNNDNNNKHSQASASNVNAGSLAERGGIQVGDILVKINGRLTDIMYHNDAQAAILNAGNQLELNIHRVPANVWSPSVTPVGRTVTNPNQAKACNVPTVFTKTSLAHDSRTVNQQLHNAGHAYNKSSKPFGSVNQQQRINNDGAQDRAGSNLVHNQYNSPMKLYSMDNIRETIEAHSELIAPGVKGINFMKPDAGVNTESEVYKLVMQEEEASRRRTSPNFSPNRSSSCERMSRLTTHNDGTIRSSSPSALPTQEGPNDKLSSNTTPICCECGQRIVGPFARLGWNKSIHSYCFKCTTCGTSLKNVGYFTVKDKLYCDIHAKQVLNQSLLGPSSQATSISAIGNQLGGHSVDNTSTLQTTKSLEPTARGQHTWQSMSHSSSMKEQQFTTRYGTNYDVNQPAKNNLRPSSNQGTQMAKTMPMGASNIKSLSLPGERVAVCSYCRLQIHGPYVLAGQSAWCKPCSQTHFNCTSCRRSLLNIGFVEETKNVYYCEQCFEQFHVPICSKCQMRVKGDCVHALDKKWHPMCFTCQHCKRPFGNSSFYLEDGAPYCETDWKQLFTTKCANCSCPIEVGDRWIEASNQSYHAQCFKCTTCRTQLEGMSFYCKGGRPYCRMHAR